MENTKLPREFYDCIDIELEQIKMVWGNSKIKVKETIFNEAIFKDMFNDIYYNSIVSYEKEFIVRTRKMNHLYRALKSNERHPDFANYSDMVPKEGSISRFSPPGKCYLYLACSKSKINIMYDEKTNYSEKTCLEEIRAVKGSNVKISSCEFKIDPRYNNYKIFDLAYSDISFDEIISMAKMKLDKSIKLSTENVKRKIKDKKVDVEEGKQIILSELKSKKSQAEIKKISNIYTVKGILKMIANDLFIPINGNDEYKNIEYKPFYALSELLSSKGYIGILYKSTRMDLINEKGDNVVFFDKHIANPKDKTLRQYYY